jgi:hypothetical protein
MFRRFLAFAFVVVSLGGIARADFLALNYQGETSTGSSLNGTPIAPDTSYTIQAIFSTPPNHVETDFGIYFVSSITAVVGGTTYTEKVPTNYAVELGGPENEIFQPFGSYFPVIENIGPIGPMGFVPIYSTPSTAGWSATDPTPTQFSIANYLDAGPNNNIQFTTAAGPLVLDFDSVTGINASITAVPVPEPSSLAVAGIATLAGLAVWARRRHLAKRAA